MAPCPSTSRSGTIEFATLSPKGHPITTGTEKFAETVAAKSGGKIKVDLFPGGRLGSDQASVTAVQGGTLEMASMNAGILASVAWELVVVDFPLLFANARQADTIMDGLVGKKLHTKLEDQGIVGLSFRGSAFATSPSARGRSPGATTPTARSGA